jgi:hypothetical protein
MLIAVVSETNSMINITGQKVYDSKYEKMPLFSLSVMRHGATERQYAEAGALVRPTRKEAMFGTYGGYYYNVCPIFRPGIVAGMVFQKESSWRTQLYYGVSIQAGIFTFVATSLGIGGGLNIPLGN